MTMERAFSRKFMLLAGILAATTILLAQAFQLETNSYLSTIKKDKDKTEQGKETQTTISAPSDAVTSNSADHTPEANPLLIRELDQNGEESSHVLAVDRSILGNIFKTFFRSVISPQAP